MGEDPSVAAEGQGKAINDAVTEGGPALGLYFTSVAIQSEVSLTPTRQPVVLGASDMVSVVIRRVLVQVFTPDEMRRRVSAVELVFIGASNELGEFESGVTAAWFGVVPAAVLGGVGTLGIVIFWSRLFPQLRSVDTLEEPG